MSYIIKKKVGEREYFYLRESKRKGGKVISKTIAYLGKNRKEAEKKALEIQKGSGKEKKGENLKEPERKENEEKIGSGKKEISIEDLTVFCKRKGFVYPSADIYGGFAGFWDFGNLGVEMKNNLKKDWWNFHVHSRDDVVGIDGSIITNPEVWKASGHVDSFSDIFVTCKKCKKSGKVDKNELGKVKCSDCGGEYDEKTAKEFKLMFKTDVGLQDYAYLRPETAQLIFINFKFVQENTRMQLPFGIAQIGKVFRNEIAPRDFLFRMREFEQMELEYFVDPKEKCPYSVGESEILVLSEDSQSKEKESEKMKFREALKKGIIKTDWHAYWLEQEYLWFIGLGASKEKFRIRQHTKDEKSHYALDTWDLEYLFPFGWKELQGMANRTDFDLKKHEEKSGVNLKMQNSKGEKILPHVVCEPSQGLDRAFLVFMFDAYNFDEKRRNVVLKLNPKLSPIKAAVFPIVKKPEYEEIARDIMKDLRQEFNVLYDKSGSIGRRYSRNDEIGTPMCITIDEDSLKKKSVTIRDRDSTKQVRIAVKDLKDVVRKVIEGQDLLKLGKLVETRIK